MKDREAHMCVNPNTCDVCNGLVMIQPTKAGCDDEADVVAALPSESNPAKACPRIVSPRHCKNEECYQTLLPSEKICPNCLSDNIADEVTEFDQEKIVSDKRLCCENPPITYGSIGCLLGPIGRFALQGE